MKFYFLLVFLLVSCGSDLKEGDKSLLYYANRKDSVEFTLQQVSIHGVKTVISYENTSNNFPNGNNKVDSCKRSPQQRVGFGDRNGEQSLRDVKP